MGEIRPGLILLAGASVVLPDRVETATVVVESGRIVELPAGPRAVGGRERRIDLTGHVIVPGFVDVHAHGVLGVDGLDGEGAVRRVAEALPRFGVTAFCPTSVACPPSSLATFLTEVGHLRRLPASGARVLGAHLESNFLNPDYAGAQPVGCLRTVSHDRLGVRGADEARDEDEDGTPFSGRDVLDVIDRHRADVSIVTLAPEVPGAAALVRELAEAGVRVSLGHTAASYEQAAQAFADGARRVTHLFNRMPPFAHRHPGLVGAALTTDGVSVEVIGDGRHVHPAGVRLAVAAKGRDGVMAITDATAGAGLAAGAVVRLGGRTITVGDVARLDDGTVAGSVLTMDRAFGTLVSACGLDLVEAAHLCATTPAREMGLVGHGALVPGAVADLVVLDSALRVVQTWISGRPVWQARRAEPDQPPPAA